MIDRTASKDPVFKEAMPDADVDRLIRNTYKVLLTRGMVGTVVYSTDPQAQNKLRELVGGRMEQAPAGVGRTAAVPRRSAAPDQTG
jgi:DUF2075 family protein